MMTVACPLCGETVAALPCRQRQRRECPHCKASFTQSWDSSGSVLSATLVAAPAAAPPPPAPPAEAEEAVQESSGQEKLSRAGERLGRLLTGIGHFVILVGATMILGGCIGACNAYSSEHVGQAVAMGCGGVAVGLGGAVVWAFGHWGMAFSNTIERIADRDG